MTSSATSDDRPVVILGAGINGAALARELVLNRVPVWLVDAADIAAGTTAYSSRLIHGGLRYLEYGELSLVRESLAERTRLLRTAPQFVRPLRLFIPARNRWGGLLSSVRRVLRLDDGGRARPRGVWLLRIGLWLYDVFARGSQLPRHQSFRTRDHCGSGGKPAIDADRYPWICSYYDAQVAFPERFTLALVEDTHRIAAARDTEFRLFTYRRATLAGARLELSDVDPASPYSAPVRPASAVANTQPALIVNATGPWVDHTLSRLSVPSPRLLTGTRGSHLFTFSPRLRERLAGEAVYAEASDGRPAFILPFAGGTLVGTTDERFSGPPEDAVATPAELDYLVQLVNDVVPGAQLSGTDIDWHYAGVRPLPRTDARSTSGVTRRHFLHEHAGGAVPLYSIVGGKLTTCRSLAEQATRQILRRLNRPRLADSRDRPLPGGDSYPADETALGRRLAALASRFRLTATQAAAIWSLCGTRAETILADLPELSDDAVAGTPFPREFVRWVIRHEWPRTLDDLVERRLMLLFHAPPTRATLEELAGLLVDAGLLAAANQETAVNRSLDRLERHFGYRPKPV